MLRRTTMFSRFSRRIRVSLTTALIQTLLAAPAFAATLRVPADYSSIQAAINAVLSGAAPDGSIVEVQPGVYYEAPIIAGSGKSITVRGLSGSGSTIVDASLANLPALRLYIASGAVRFEGFTFRGGVGGPGTGGGFTFQESSPDLVDVVFENSRAMDGGGGVIFKSSPRFAHCEIRNNTADRFGGGLLIITGSRPSFSDCRIRDNVSGAGGAGTGNIGMGGGVHINDASPSFRGCLITGNRSKFAAGGIILIGTYTSTYGAAAMLLEDTEVSNNIAERFSPAENPAEGGGVHIEDNATAYLVRATIRNNTANTGGGLSSYRARFEITGSIIDGNHAQDPQAVGGFGGGIDITSNNVSSPFRPAGSLSLVDTVVRNNDARRGAGMMISGDQYCGGSPCTSGAARASAQITDSLISDNVAAVYGGGVLADRVDLTITGSHILRNIVNTSGLSDGGGLVLATLTAATITSTTIARNSAVDYGGGIYLDTAASLTMSGSRVYANTAANGGGLFVGGTASGSVQSSIIADNAMYQIYEQACGPVVRTILAYVNNNITPRSAAPDLYFSGCGGATSTIAGLNASPSMRSSGNTSTAPSFVAFLATPDLAPAVLSWSVARASNVTISTLSPFSGDTGTVAVSPASTTAYSLTSTGGPAGAVTAGVRVAIAWGIPTDTPVAGDFDGDGKRDLAVYRSTTGMWYILGSSTGYRQTPWGAFSVGDVPVPADYDGDGKTDIAVFRTSTGQWFILRSTGGSTTMSWGYPPVGDVPVPRDYDGDGRADVAVYRMSTGMWYIAYSRGGSGAFSWGAPSLGDIPVPADYDGDGRTDLAVYRSSTGIWYRALSGGGSTAGVGWGAPAVYGLGDTPVPADYDGDGKADIAIARAATGDWYVLKSGGGTLVKRVGSGDVQLPGNYEGSSAAEIALYRGATGSWLIVP
ncbi:MAG: FG-GAP-like repeat-containing protein [Acidobacteriota bacterium]